MPTAIPISEAIQHLRRIRLDRGLSFRALAALISGESDGAVVSYSTIRKLLERPDPQPHDTTRHLVCAWVARELRRERRRARG